MKNSFSEVKLFQVKPDKLIEFETLITTIADQQKQQTGCIASNISSVFLPLMVSRVGNRRES